MEAAASIPDTPSPVAAGAGSGHFDVKVILPNAPTESHRVRHGTTVAALGKKLGLTNAGRAAAVVGTGDLVDGSHVLTPDDARISFVTRLSGAVPQR